MVDVGGSFPFRGTVVWLTPEQGGRASGPPAPPGDYAATAFVPPHTYETGLASFVLRGFEPGAWTSRAEGRWLVPEHVAADRPIAAGTDVVLTEGRQVVGHFHVEQVVSEDGVMGRAAAVAARVLAELWPDGRAVIDVESHASDFVVSGRHDGVTVVRTGEGRGAALWDVVDLGDTGLTRPLPRGAARTPDGRISVTLPRRPLRRRPRPVHWTEAEVEDLCRQLNDQDVAVLGLAETSCRVCGFDDPSECRYVGGAPQYVICPCCGSESGVDDLRPESVRRARDAWVAHGRPWREPGQRPADWDPGAALAALPARWRDR